MVETQQSTEGQHIFVSVFKDTVSHSTVTQFLVVKHFH